jgi:hypothetical protein
MLERRIERYRLPRRVQRNGEQLSSRRLKPVFRDRDEMTAVADLTTAVRKAIGASEHLIVVCTPHSAASNWVTREIGLFRSKHGRAAILAALFDGDIDTAFNPELLVPNRGVPMHPLAADFRPGGDGRLALLKLVAVLAGVQLDELVRRDAQRRRHQLFAWAACITVVVGLIASMFLMALGQRAEARAEQQRGIATITQLVEQREELSKAGNLDLLRSYDRTALGFFRGRDVSTLPASAQLLSAKLLQGIAEDDESAGDFPALETAATAAWRTTDRLLRSDGAAPDRILAHCQSEFWLGLAAWRLGKLAAAERHFSAYAALTGRLVALAPDKPAWLKEAGDADSNLATYYLRQSDLARAGPFFRRAQERFERAARPGYDSEIWRDLADSYGWRADIARLGGDYDTAMGYRMDQRHTLEVMRTHEPGNAKIESGLIKNQLGIARLLAAQKRWAQAIAAFDAGRAQAQARAQRDPSNADMAVQARAFDLFEVHAWLDMPPSMRPPPSRIAAVLDGCAPERAKSNKNEGAIFCAILGARLKLQQGESLAGDSAVRSLCMQGDAHGLSERWRLDLQKEIEFLRCADHKPRSI